MITPGLEPENTVKSLTCENSEQVSPNGAIHRNVLLRQNTFMTAISFRDADKQNDFEFGKTVHHSAYREVVSRQFGSWDELIQDGFFKEGWNRGPHKIILVGVIPVGIYSLAEHPDHLFFSEIQILPEYQGNGLGTKILKEQIQYAKSLGLPLRLQVLRENKAQELYLRLGFTVTGTTDTHIKMEWQDNK